MIWTIFQLALRQLLRNKARTGLTSLGILIGVAAVIAMVSIGSGATQKVEDDLGSLGKNMIYVMPGSHGGPGGRSRPFQETDADAIRGQIAGVAAVAPIVQRGAVASAGEQTWSTTVTGSTADYLVVGQWELQRGRAFDSGELLSGAAVCLIGETVRSELFGAQDALDQPLRLDTLTCRVVGVLGPKGHNTFGQDQDDLVVLPLRTLQRRLQGNRDINAIFVSAHDGVDTAQVRSDIEALMLQRRRIREGTEADFLVRDMAELTGMLTGITKVLTSFLAAVAAVSLLVGGIGIMNIMLVSVTERTREIGIRLAVGALARDVLLQFLVESMVLATVGGLAGIALGLLASWGASRALEIDLVVSPLLVLLAFAFSAFIGVVFGYYPARRAARMKPIDALRHE